MTAAILITTQNGRCELIAESTLAMALLIGLALCLLASVLVYMVIMVEVYAGAPVFQRRPNPSKPKLFKPILSCLAAGASLWLYIQAGLHLGWLTCAVPV